jgi:CBS domain-containing protein
MKVVIERFTRDVVTAAPQDCLADVARLMDRHNVGAVVVVENHQVVGIVTDRDLALEMGARGRRPETPVVRVMATPAMTLHQDEGVFAATQAMRDAGVRRLPVVDEDGRVTGIVTLDDLLHVLARELYNLTQCIHSERALY